MKKLSIVIPVYNEKKTLLSLLSKVESSFVGDLEKEIILIDDCSNDGTREIMEGLLEKGKYKILFQEKNSGKGKALRTGFAKATGDFILIQDADLEYNPDEYLELLKPLLDGRADVVYGSRFMGDKAHRALFFYHYIGNKFLTLFSNIFTNLNLTDVETCYKVFSKEALSKIMPDLRANRFGIEPEITALVSKNKMKIYEVGISYAGRTYDEGKKINWKDGFSAIYTIIFTKLRFTSLGKDKLKLGLLFILVFLSAFSIGFLQPKISGDSVSYIEGIEVLKTGIVPSGFTPYRIITTYFGLKSVIFIDTFFNNISFSWLLLNSIMFILMGMFFYSLLNKILNDSKTSFLSTLFLMTNYAIISFGLSYLMDMGGWLFYVASLYFSYLYLERKEQKWLWISSLLIGFGGLFKEYAFLAFVVIFGCILFLNWKEWKKIIKLSLFAGLLSFGPMIIVNIYSLSVYNYTYFSWYKAQSVYSYQNKIVEYIKSFGSLYNFGWLLFIPGVYLYLKRYKEILKNKKLFFIFLVVLSSCVVFVWPVVTRVLFITMPAVVLISGLYIQKIKKIWLYLVPILVVYILSSYLMESLILNFVNLPF